MQCNVHKVVSTNFVASYGIVKRIGNQEQRSVHPLVGVPREHAGIGKEARYVFKASYVDIVLNGMLVIIVEGIVESVPIHSDADDDYNKPTLAQRTSPCNRTNLSRARLSISGSEAAVHSIGRACRNLGISGMFTDLIPWGVSSPPTPISNCHATQVGFLA